jgi:heme A synthase
LIIGASLLVALHTGFKNVVLLYSIAVAIWGFFLYFRGSNPTGSFLGAIAINFGVVILQGFIGLLLVLQGHRPHDGLHYLYGGVSLLVLPAAYFFSNAGRERRDSLIFGIAALLLFGIGIRAAMTGGG